MLKTILRDFVIDGAPDKGKADALQDFWNGIPLGMFANNFFRRSSVSQLNKAMPWLEESPYEPFLHTALGDLIIYDSDSETFVAYDHARNKLQECGVRVDYLLSDLYNPFFQREMFTPEPYSKVLETMIYGPSYGKVFTENGLLGADEFFSTVTIDSASWV